jgi:hypothetical protein
MTNDDHRSPLPPSIPSSGRSTPDALRWRGTCIYGNQRGAQQPAGNLFLHFSTARQSSLRRSSLRSTHPSPACGGASVARNRLVVFCLEAKMRVWRGPRRTIKMDTAKSTIPTITRARLSRIDVAYGVRRSGSHSSPAICRIAFQSPKRNSTLSKRTSPTSWTSCSAHVAKQQGRGP